jgi:hypothetical protein
MTAKSHLGFSFQFSTHARELFRFLFYIVSGALFGSILSDSNILSRIQRCSAKFKESDFPKTSNLAEELLLDGTLSDELLIFEMSNHKFYVAHVKEADIEDTIPFDEKGLVIKPLLSGSRLPTEKFVKYDVRYVSDAIFESFQQFSELSTKEIEQLESQMLAEIEQIDVILLYQKNIVSIRKFNAALFNKFKEDSPANDPSNK